MSFQLPDLNYGFDALEPHIDTKTAQIHHGNTMLDTLKINKQLKELILKVKISKVFYLKWI